MVFWKLVNSNAKPHKYSKIWSPSPQKFGLLNRKKMKILKTGMLCCQNDLKKNLPTLDTGTS